MKEVNLKKISLQIIRNKSVLSITFLFTFFAANGLAQSNFKISGQTMYQLNQTVTNFSPTKVILTPNENTPSTKFSFIEKPSMPSIPKIYAYDELAFFCKIEVKLEQASKMPVKFRLGTVDYVDKMEGKR